MIKIDGSKGEGGGQVLRSALSLAMLTGKPFTIENIRGGRKKPGLLRQHLTCVEAACKISDGKCDDAALGATALDFTPGTAKAGNYRFSVGSAGSAHLVLQTILPPLLVADDPSVIIIEGGTHNQAAPPFEFIENSFLPLINTMGAKVTARLLQHGFYPAGGGRIEVQITPASQLVPLHLTDRGKLVKAHGNVLISAIPGKIAVKENSAAEKVLGWGNDVMKIEPLSDACGPGNAMILTAQFENVTEIVSGFGEKGVPAFRVGQKTANRMKGYMESKAAIGPYLADQLLLPIAMAGGGSFTTVKPSAHSRTNTEIIAMFTDIKFTFEQQENGAFLVSAN